MDAVLPAVLLVQLGFSAWIIYRHRRWLWVVLPLVALLFLWSVLGIFLVAMMAVWSQIGH